MTEKQVHDYVIKMKHKFHPKIQEIIDTVPEEMKRSDKIFESPMEKISKPIDNFLQGVLEQIDNMENNFVELSISHYIAYDPFVITFTNKKELYKYTTGCSASDKKL